MAGHVRYGNDKLPPPIAPPVATVQRRNPFACWRGGLDVEAWDPRRIYHFRWGCLSVQNGVLVLAAWRTFVSLYLFCTVTYDWSTYPVKAKYLVYLTNWSIWSAIIHFVTDATIGWCVWRYYRRYQLHGADASTNPYPKHVRDPFLPDSGPSLYLDITPGKLTMHAYRLSLMAFQISVTFESLVLSLYWSLLYRYDHNTAEKHVWINSTVHGVGAISLLVDVLLGCHRPLDFHVFFVLLLGAIYTVVNAVFTIESGTPVYSVLTWKTDDPGTWGVVFGAIIGMVVFFFAISTIAWLRDRLARKGRKACVWKRPNRIDLGLNAGLYEGPLNAASVEDMDDDESDDGQLDWYAGAQQNVGSVATKEDMLKQNKLPLFSLPRFLDTKKAFPFGACHANACRYQKKDESFKGWNLVHQDLLPPGENSVADLTAKRAFTGTESDARSDALYPI